MIICGQQLGEWTRLGSEDNLQAIVENLTDANGGQQCGNRLAALQRRDHSHIQQQPKHSGNEYDYNHCRYNAPAK